MGTLPTLAPNSDRANCNVCFQARTKHWAVDSNEALGLKFSVWTHYSYLSTLQLYPLCHHTDTVTEQTLLSIFLGQNIAQSHCLTGSLWTQVLCLDPWPVLVYMASYPLTPELSVRIEPWLGVLGRSDSSSTPKLSTLALDNHSSTSTVKHTHRKINMTIISNRHLVFQFLKIMDVVKICVWRRLQQQQQQTCEDKIFMV